MKCPKCEKEITNNGLRCYKDGERICYDCKYPKSNITREIESIENKPVKHTIILTKNQLDKIVRQLEKTTNCPSRYNLKNLDCNKKGSNIKCIDCIKHALLTANKEEVK